MTGDRKKIRIKYIFFLFFLLLLIAVSANNAMSSIPKEHTKKDLCNSVNDKFMQFGWKG